MESIKNPNKYILAVVYDVIYNPRHFFMSLSDSVHENEDNGDNEDNDDTDEAEDDD